MVGARRGQEIICFDAGAPFDAGSPPAILSLPTFPGWLAKEKKLPDVNLIPEIAKGAGTTSLPSSRCCFRLFPFLPDIWEGMKVLLGHHQQSVGGCTDMREGASRMASSSTARACRAMPDHPLTRAVRARRRASRLDASMSFARTASVSKTSSMTMEDAALSGIKPPGNQKTGSLTRLALADPWKRVNGISSM